MIAQVAHQSFDERLKIIIRIFGHSVSQAAVRNGKVAREQESRIAEEPTRMTTSKLSSDHNALRSRMFQIFQYTYQFRNCLFLAVNWTCSSSVKSVIIFQLSDGKYTHVKALSSVFFLFSTIGGLFGGW